MALTAARFAERPLAAYNAVVAALWLTTAHGPLAALLGAAHLAAATLPWLFGAAPPRRATNLLRDLYPLLLVPALWIEMDLLHRAQAAPLHDAAVAALDLRLFGAHWNLLWMPAMPVRWLSELMQAVYFGYYAAVFGAPLLLYLAGRREGARELIQRLVITAIGCSLVYVFFPVAGPAITLPQYSGPLTDGFFYQLNHAAHAAGDAVGTAFPSSHVAYAVTMAIAARRCCPRWAAALLATEAVGVCFAVVYTQNHYPIDAVAGVALAAALQLGLVPALQRAGRSAPRRAVAARYDTPFPPSPAPATGGGA